MGMRPYKDLFKDIIKQDPLFALHYLKSGFLGGPKAFIRTIQHLFEIYTK